MDKDFYNYLFKFWKINYTDICKYCSNIIECKNEACDKYENYGRKGFFVSHDGKETFTELNFDMTCMDLNFGDCPKLENTPCHDCLQNDLVGFTWNNKIPDNCETF